MIVIVFFQKKLGMKIILPFLLVPLASSLKPFDDHHVEIVQVSARNIAGILIDRQVKASLEMYHSRKQILFKVSKIKRNQKRTAQFVNDHDWKLSETSMKSKKIYLATCLRSFPMCLDYEISNTKIFRKKSMLRILATSCLFEKKGILD